jgi:tetratricopeptide (TPR) repeat protein/predicted aspartyl protease
MSLSVSQAPAGSPVAGVSSACGLKRHWLRRCALWLLPIALMVGTPPLDAEPRCTLDELSVLPVSMHGMRAIVPATINGRSVTMIVDSGLSRSMLTYAAMAELGLKREPSTTAFLKGVTGAAPVESTETAVLEFGSLSLRNIHFFVGGSGSNRGASGLIGRDLLSSADVEYDLANGIIRFVKLQECAGSSPVYWKSASPVITLPIIGEEGSSKAGVGRQLRTTASLNGVTLRVLLDTGAGMSMVSSHAAQEAGITSTTPGVVPEPMAVGLAGRPVKTWVATFSSLRIGHEEVKNARLRFGDLNSENVDMFLGADFFLSHRILVADSQHTIYATYNGGSVFDPGPGATSHESVTTYLGDPTARATAEAAPRLADHNSPTDAAGFSRRGMAFASRRDYEHAIADLTRACELDAGQATYFLERAQVHRTAGRLLLAQADLDRALSLKPDDAEVLVARAGARIDAGNRSGARSDLDAAASHAGATADLRFDIAALYARMILPTQALAQVDLWASTHRADPKMPAAQNMRCLTKGLLNADLDEALRACDAALISQPQSAAGLSNRGLVRFRAGQYEAALADFDAALALKPDLAVTLYRRGIAKLRLGRHTDGNADLGAARALDMNIEANERAWGIVP